MKKKNYLGQLEGRFHGEASRGRTFLSKIDEKLIFEWADEKPNARYPQLAWHVQMLNSKEKKVTEWSDWALKFLDHSSDFSTMLDVFIARLYPSSWEGSLADILNERASLLETLPIDESNKLQLQAEVQKIRESAKKERLCEASRSRREYESFE